MSSVLGQIRDTVVTQLAAQAWAGDYAIPVLARRRGLVTSDLATAIEGIRKPAIIVLLPIPVAGDPNLPAAHWREVQIEVQVVEMRELNRSGVDAEQVAEWVIGALHHYKPALLDQCHHLWLDGQAPYDADENGDPYLITLQFRAKATLAEGIAYTATALSLTGLAAQMAEWIDAALVATGGFDSAQMPVFSTYDVDTPTYVRNASNWAAAADLTSAHAWNSATAKNLGCTAITPRHVIMADHAKLPVGTSLHFVEADGTVHTRTITTRESVSGADLFHDICVGRLSSDLPAGIAPAKILQSTIVDDCGGSAYLKGVPLLALDKEEHSFVVEVNNLSATASSLYASDDGQVLNMRQPVETNPARDDWYEAPVSGDSGNPIYAINDDGEVALASLWSFSASGSAAGGGPFLAHWITEIDALITSLGGGGSVTETDWTVST